MIELGVMTVLAADAGIQNRISAPGVGNRIYLGRIPQGVKADGAVVVNKISRTRDYGLTEEAGSKFTTLQIDCYDTTAKKADELAELVAALLAGAGAIGLTAGDHKIASGEIIGERTQFEKPSDATDFWRPRDSRDYRIHHN